MIASANFVSSPDPLHARFEALLPRIQRHGEVYFRDVKCPVKKADYIAEMVALVWKWIVQLAQKGRDGFQFPMALARYAACAVRCGRKLAGMAKAKDVMNEMAQQRHRFKVEALPFSISRSHENFYAAVRGQREMDVFEERLIDNRKSPVAEQAAFRIDFGAWLQSLTPRERRLIKAMARNERTKDLARQFEVSAARISQLRREFMEGWRRYWNEEPSSGVA